MGNPRRIRKLGTLEDAQKELWRAVTYVRDVMSQDYLEVEVLLRAVHAHVQAVSAYVKVLEKTDLKEEIEALKAEIAAIKKGQGLKKVA